MNSRHRSKTGARRGFRVRADRQEMLSRYHGSGLTQRQFAWQEGIGLSTLQLWLKLQRQAERSNRFPIDAPEPQLLEVTTVPAGFAPEAADFGRPPFLYEIGLGSELTLRLAADFCPAKARQLLEALRELKGPVL